MTAKEQQQTAEISTDLAGKRLDQALAALFPEFSRSRLSAWTKEGRVLLNGETVRPRDAVKLGDQVQLTAVIEDQVECRPQQVDFEVVCSKGTYIRSLAHDYGKALESGAHLSALRRTKIGEYEVASALTPKEIKKSLCVN